MAEISAGLHGLCCQLGCNVDFYHFLSGWAWGKEAAAASGNTFVGVVEAGAGCDDAKVLTPAMDAATKQCSDKACGAKLSMVLKCFECVKESQKML